MQRVTAPPPVRPSGVAPKPPVPLKRLDDALMALVRRRESDAGIMPGLPFN